MVDSLWHTEPEVGDRVWMKPERVGGRSTVKAKNPFKWGDDLLHLANERLEAVLDEKDVKAIRKGRGPFNIESPPVYGEITEIGRGILLAEVLPQDEWPEGEQGVQNSIEWNERTEAIEWTGTKQTRTDNSKNRSSVFNKEDLRGSKNDLLGGHH